MMEKLNGESMNLNKENIEKLKKLFPNIVSDGKIDFDMLKTILGEEVDSSNERYSFTWNGKYKTIKLAQTPSTGTLIPCKEKSVNWDKTNNIYIEGDNLESLKLILKTYYSKIDVIYIDPPYNTGNDFVYKDDFKNSIENYKTITKQALHLNPETNGRFHTDWLNMIYPRLVLARDLLSEDGIIFISIDDNEQSNLKKICDEIFGEFNIVCQFIWEKTQHFGRQKLNSYCNNDYILCYAKNIANEKLKELLVENVKTELQDAPLFNASNNLKIINFPKGSTKFNMPDGTYIKTTSNDYELLNPVMVKNGKNENDFSLKFKSRWSDKTVQEEIQKGTNFWVKTESFAIRAIYGGEKESTDAPRQIIFTNSANPMMSKSRFGERIDTSENATKQLYNLLGQECFSYPKPVSLIKYLISLVYDYKKREYKKDITVLDFFSGSGTVGQAVIELNAIDGGHRKYILVQLPEICDEETEAYKTGYKTICEIGEERIRRAGKKIKDENPLITSELDTGFKVFKLDSTNIRPWDSSIKLDESDILNYYQTIKEGRKDIDVAYEIMLKYGVFDMPLKETIISNKKMFDVGNGHMIICLADQITMQDVTEIAKLNPHCVVFKESEFKDDNEKINATYTLERFKVEKILCI